MSVRMSVRLRTRCFWHMALGSTARSETHSHHYRSQNPGEEVRPTAPGQREAERDGENGESEGGSESERKRERARASERG